MFGISPPFWVQPGPTDDYSIIGRGNTAGFTDYAWSLRTERVSNTSVIFFYAQFFNEFIMTNPKAKAVVVTDGGRYATFGTPVTLSTVDSINVGGIHLLDSGLGRYLVTYLGTNGKVYGQVITVSGTTITPGTETMILSVGSYSRVASAVMSAAAGVVTAEDSTGDLKVKGAGLSISGTTIFPTSESSFDFTSSGTSYNELIAGSSSAIYVGATSDAAPFYYSTQEITPAGVISPATKYTPPAGQRVTQYSGGVVTLGSITSLGAGLGVLIFHEQATGKVAATRVQGSGGVSSYSNPDSSANPLDSGPYTAPVIPEQKWHAKPDFSNSRLIMPVNRSGNIVAFMLQVTGNVNMAAEPVTLVDDGTFLFQGIFRVDVSYMQDSRAILGWIGNTNGILQATIIGAGNTAVSELLLDSTIKCSVGNASAAGPAATITTYAGTINCTVGAATAEGITASIDVVSGGAAYFQVGRDALFRSTDLVTWTSITVPSGNWTDITRITSSRLIMIGDSSGTNSIATSDDNGVTWTARTRPTNTLWDAWKQAASNGTNQMVLVAHGSDDDANFAKSTTGTTWTNSISALNPSQYLDTVIWNGSRFIASLELYGTGDWDLHSTDGGNTWFPGYMSDSRSWTSRLCTNGSGTTIRLGHDGSGVIGVARNTSGISWTESSIPGLSVGSFNPWEVIWDGSQFVGFLTGTWDPGDMYFITSTTGAAGTWSEIGPMTDIYDPRDLQWDGTQYILTVRGAAGSDDEFWASPDLSTSSWTLVGTHTFDGTATYQSNRFVAITT